MILERSSQQYEATDVEGHGNVARPIAKCESWCDGGSNATGSPETRLCLEYTVVAADREVHDPVIEVSAKDFTDQYSNLCASPTVNSIQEYIYGQ